MPLHSSYMGWLDSQENLEQTRDVTRTDTSIQVGINILKS